MVKNNFDVAETNSSRKNVQEKNLMYLRLHNFNVQKNILQEIKKHTGTNLMYSRLHAVD